MYSLLGMWWIVGTVYFIGDSVVAGGMPLQHRTLLVV